MSTHDAAERRRKAWDRLPPEVKKARLDKMREGREQRIGQGHWPREAVGDTEAEALKRRIKELEALLKTQPQPRSVAAVPETEPNRAWRYEFTRTNRGGPESITTLDDPRWNELANFNRDCFGTFIVQTALGETCLSRGPRPALEMAQRFVLTGTHVQPLNDREVKA